MVLYIGDLTNHFVIRFVYSILKGGILFSTILTKKLYGYLKLNSLDGYLYPKKY
jgi:hypothetical protein